MISNQISQVIKQALLTFTGRSDKFLQNYDSLKILLSKTTSTDVNLSTEFTIESFWNKPGKAPVTYINIYEDSNISMSIFILKPKMTLPLHNHPKMYGLIKILFGEVFITSYSINTEKTSNYISNSHLLTAERCLEKIINSNDDCCIVEPEKLNLHEIQSVNGPAAFLDILAPPYETKTDDNEVRKCAYYKIIKEISSNIFALQEISCPYWYWNDNFPYTGPNLDDVKVNSLKEI